MVLPQVKYGVILVKYTQYLVQYRVKYRVILVTYTVILAKYQVKYRAKYLVKYRG